MTSNEFYLVVSKKNRWSTRVRLSINSPRMEPNEVAVKMKLELPDALFDKPQLQAKVSIPESSVSPQVIDATVIDNIQDAIKSVTGLEIKVSVVEEKKEEISNE